MSEELKPCPFCGEREDLSCSDIDGVLCKSCGTSVMSIRTDSDRQAWNRRAPLTTQDTSERDLASGFKIAMPNGDVLTRWGKYWNCVTPEGHGATNEEDWEVVEAYGLDAVVGGVLKALSADGASPAERQLEPREDLNSPRIKEVGEGESSSNASHAATGPLPRIATNAEPSAACSLGNRCHCGGLTSRERGRCDNWAKES